MNDWISVNDPLQPEIGKLYLVSGHNGTPFIALKDYLKWMRQSGSKRIDGITHWMPIPPLPEETTE